MATSIVSAKAGHGTLEQGSTANAIDDLIKFRLIESMLRQPDVWASADELARRLGFHSVEYTGLALDELVFARVLQAERVCGELRYGLVADARVRGQLAELIAAGPPNLFNRLAAGSVQRVKRLLGKRS